MFGGGGGEGGTVLQTDRMKRLGLVKCSLLLLVFIATRRTATQHTSPTTRKIAKKSWFLQNFNLNKNMARLKHGLLHTRKMSQTNKAIWLILGKCLKRNGHLAGNVLLPCGTLGRLRRLLRPPSSRAQRSARPMWRPMVTPTSTSIVSCLV